MPCGHMILTKIFVQQMHSWHLNPSPKLEKLQPDPASTFPEKNAEWFHNRKQGVEVTVFAHGKLWNLSFSPPQRVAAGQMLHITYQRITWASPMSYKGEDAEGVGSRSCQGTQLQQKASQMVYTSLLCMLGEVGGGQPFQWRHLSADRLLSFFIELFVWGGVCSST